MRTARFPISTLLDSASGHLEAHLQKKRETRETTNNSAPPTQYAGIIFSGNPHETVPRRLLLDDRLTPLERNCWQVFRLLVNADGITAFPTYDQLRPYLGMQPGKHASRETVAKALTVLRLTRWLSLGRKVRNEMSGQVQGNIYLLHDEPVTPAEAVEFDQGYMQLMEQSMEHQNRAISTVAEIAWREFTNDPDVGRRLPSRIDTVTDRLNAQAWAAESQHDAHPAPEFGIRTQPDIPEPALSSDSELSGNSVKRSTLPLGSDSELSGNSPSSARVRNPNSYSTYTNTHKNVCKSSVLSTEDIAARWLLAMDTLPAEQKMKALGAMQKVPDTLRNAVMTQWLHRCSEGTVGKPLAYLMSLVGLAVRGEFNADWRPENATALPSSGTPTVAGKTPSRPTEPVTEPAPPGATATSRTPETMRTAREQLAAMQHLLRPRQGPTNSPSSGTKAD